VTQFPIYQSIEEGLRLRTLRDHGSLRFASDGKLCHRGATKQVEIRAVRYIAKAIFCRFAMNECVVLGVEIKRVPRATGRQGGCVELNASVDADPKPKNAPEVTSGMIWQRAD